MNDEFNYCAKCGKSIGFSYRLCRDCYKNREEESKKNLQEVKGGIE